MKAIVKEKIEKSPKKAKTPNVGVGVFIFDYSEDVPHILLGRRKNKEGWGAGEYSLPGGNIEIGEKAVDAVIREVFEETELYITNPIKVGFNDAIYPEFDKYYITVYFSAQAEEGRHPNDKNGRPTAINTEPEKCEGWNWYPVNNLPQPLFGGIQEILNDWDWKKEITAIEAILHGGKEFITPYAEPILRLKNYLDKIKFVKNGDNSISIFEEKPCEKASNDILRSTEGLTTYFYEMFKKTKGKFKR